MARELQPDMVLMDVLMPELDGISATRTIKEELPDIKILMLTGLDDPAVISDSLQAGADGFCPKYLSSEQLIAAIKTVGEGNMWLPSLYANQLRKTLSLSERVAQPAGISADVKYGRLSKREQEVLQLMVSGLNNREIADRLVLSAETVKTHVRHIFEKMAVKRRTEAVLEALRLGLVSAA
jgi:DNA-binding NarL/FixJ family response regulator